MTAVAITPEDYAVFSAFLQDACGIVLGDNKHYLVTSRLTRLMADEHLASFSVLMARMRTDSKLRIKIMDAMTTNETSWFRDTHPYEALKEKILPELAARKVKDVRIWSAACSTGQEPYSIAMVLAELQQSRPGLLPAGSVQILGTDISPSVVEQAKHGIYEQTTIVRGLSEERRGRYFRLQGSQWQVTEELQKRVTFRELNLMQPYTALGKFDVIFCRNVLIYFSADLKRDILLRLRQALKPGGYLMLGGSESISNYVDGFDLLRWRSGVIYQVKS